MENVDTPNEKPLIEPMWSFKRVAEHFGVSVNTLFLWKRKGIIRTVMIGRFNRVPQSEVEKLMAGKYEVKRNQLKGNKQ